jgi:hypothetical protein
VPEGGGQSPTTGRRLSAQKRRARSVTLCVLPVITGVTRKVRTRADRLCAMCRRRGRSDSRTVRSSELRTIRIIGLNRAVGRTSRPIPNRGSNRRPSGPAGPSRTGGPTGGRPDRPDIRTIARTAWSPRWKANLARSDGAMGPTRDLGPWAADNCALGEARAPRGADQQRGRTSATGPTGCAHQR